MRKIFAVLLTLGLLSPVAQATADMAKPKTKGAPGPIAGAGLPFVILGGAYWLYRRRNPGSKKQQ